MTRILALDASTEACSVALQCDGEVVERFEILPRLHARKLLPMVESLLADFELKLSQLDCLAFGRGPGLALLHSHPACVANFPALLPSGS